jgi:peptidyl-prolyl cis-trans isomerase D
MHDQAQQRFIELSERLVDLSYADADSLDGIAETLHLSKKVSPWLTSDANSQKGLFKSQSLIRAAFSDQVLDQRLNSSLIAINDDQAVVVRAAEHKPSALRTLSEVKTSIQSTLQKSAIHQAQLDKAASLVEALNKLSAKASRASLWRTYHLTPKSEVTLQRGKKSSQISQQMSDQAFSMPLKRGSIQAKVVDSGAAGVTVIYIVESTPGKLPEKSQQQLLKQFDSQYAEMEYIAASLSVVGKAKINMPTVNNG